MNIIKSEIRSNFTIVPNEVIRDRTLSPNALALYVLLASKSNEWQFYHNALASEMNMTEKTLRKYIGELIEKEYLVQVERRNEGKFATYDYIIKVPSVKITDGKNYRLINKELINKENNIDISEIKQNVIRYFIDKVDGAYPVVPDAALYDNLKTIIDKGYTIEQIKKLIDHKAAQFHRREIDTKVFRLSWMFKPVNFFEQYSIMERPAKPKERKTSSTNNGAKVTTDYKKWDDVKSL